MAQKLVTSPVEFKVHRRVPELISPSKPTPHELKYLSEIDSQKGLQFQIPVIHFYPNNPTAAMQGKDPVRVIREAIAKTLVFYYPFAGRLREVTGSSKLMVECTGEGILFIEADADATLEHFGDALQPPFPCFEDLLFDVPGSSGILNCPLLLVQVTRLKCGGFILAIRLNHTMSDGPGLAQFMCAVGEIARGQHSPSVLPVWERHLLSSLPSSHNPCTPQLVTHQHLEYDYEDAAAASTATTTTTIINLEQEIVHHHRSFFFGPKEIEILRSLTPPALLPYCTTLEILTAWLWKCRTMALQVHPTEDVRVMTIVNARNKFNPPLPQGYYGNAFAFPAAVTTAGKLYQDHPSLGYALELVRNAKAQLTQDYMRSVAALMAARGDSLARPKRSYIVSDIRHVGFQDVDFGWGKAAFCGVARAGAEDYPDVTYVMSFTNKKGETGIVVPLCLPALAMHRFEKELEIIFLKKKQPSSPHNVANSDFTKSSL
ncbi:hypothetical protein Tsubulata_041412, partial [Turnera subulata]